MPTDIKILLLYISEDYYLVMSWQHLVKSQKAYQ